MSDFPVGLSDEQLAAIIDAAAETLRPGQRSKFLTTVVAALPATATNAAVSRAINDGLRSLQVVG